VRSSIRQNQPSSSCYITTNNLLYEVFNNLRGRRKPIDYKLIDLTNKSLFLYISKEFIVYRGRFLFKGINASISLYKGYTLNTKIPSHLDIIKY
jgi:hypothetical protein